jgi:potassium-transporting ATPase KdpC subunit
MRRQLLTALLVLGMMTLLVGLAYPLGVTAVAHAVFPDQANGSLVEVDGVAVGSRLLAQRFTGDRWFHPRPSSAGDGYDPASSGGSNLGPTSPELLDAVEARAAAYRSGNDLPSGVPVPVDAVTASGSGLDPHISIANARLQALRVAAARELDAEVVLDLVEDHVERRPLGVLGDPGVNVLLLNLAVDRVGAPG